MDSSREGHRYPGGNRARAGPWRSSTVTQPLHPVEVLATAPPDATPELRRATGVGGVDPLAVRRADVTGPCSGTVLRYGEGLGSALRQAFDDVAAHVSTGFVPVVANLEEGNDERVQVELQGEVEVRALEPADEDDPFDPCAHLPDRPRVWRPRTSSTLFGLPRVDGTSLDGLTREPFDPAVEIENGRSTTLRCDTLHLHPGGSAPSDSVVVVVSEGTTSRLRAMWRATATNVDGQTCSEVEVPVEGDVVDLWDALGTTAWWSRACRCTAHHTTPIVVSDHGFDHLAQALWRRTRW